MRLRRAIFALATVAALGCEGRPRPPGEEKTETPKRTGPAVAVVDLAGGVPEQDKMGIFGVPGSKRSFDELLRVTEAVKKDERSVAVLVKLASAPIGAARAEEIARVLAELRATKPVVCHADSLSNTTLMVVSKGCSSVWLSPSGAVESVGLAAQVVYMRRLLADELHLTIDMLQVGKFKGADEPLTRDGPSPEARASLEGVLRDMRRSWLEGLSARPAARPEIVEDGPWSPPRAKELGLVDEIGYVDEALEAAKSLSGAVRQRAVFGSGSEEKSGDLGELIRLIAGETSATGPIALVRATGSIAMSPAGNGIFGGSGGIVEKEFNRTIARLEKDDGVKAVVVRIDSPGGSALASDLMWHALMKLRKKKPLVFSVGDMAASGGYYLASTGDYILAEPMSIVGSIGVVGGKITVGGALERIGVHTETFVANADKEGAATRAAYASPLVAWDDATKVRIREAMTAVYDLFLARIVEGRSTRGRTVTVRDVEANAEGKIFSGTEGKARGLVDELGGLNDAIAKARELAGLPESARVAVVTPKSSLLDVLDPELAQEKIRGSAAPGAAIEVLDRMAPEAVPFVTSLLPLAEGERTAVAVPFVLTVR